MPRSATGILSGPTMRADLAVREKSLTVRVSIIRMLTGNGAIALPLTQEMIALAGAEKAVRAETMVTAGLQAETPILKSGPMRIVVRRDASLLLRKAALIGE